MVLFANTNVIAREEINANVESESENESNYKSIDGFRDFEWGTKKDEIISSEVTEDMIEGVDYGFTKDENTLIFINGDVGGYNSYIYYGFDDDNLVYGQYILTEQHTNENEYYNDYLNIVLKYDEKYGKADIYNANWKEDRYKGENDKIGMAIATGGLTIITEWNDDNNGSRIVAFIGGDNYEISTSITYYSPDYEEKDNSDEI